MLPPPQADFVIMTNNNPGFEDPSDIIADIAAGFPEDVTSRHPGSAFPWLQDIGHVPMWFESTLLEYQYEVMLFPSRGRHRQTRGAFPP
jgi:hypothetical protein